MKKVLLTLISAIMAITTNAQGSFQVFDLDGFKLHVYNSGDVMADASYVIEGKDSLVLMEEPLFKTAASQFSEYVLKLGKPVARRVADYHIGASGNHPLTFAEGMSTFVKGPVYGGMMKHFQQQFGDKMVALPDGPTDEVPFGDTVVWAGVPFKFTHGASSDFPAAAIIIGGQVYYTHWTPAKAHISPLQVSSPAAVDAEIAAAETELNSGAKLFIGGHGGATDKSSVEFKINYLKKVKELLGKDKTADTFIADMKTAFPGLPGEENLAGLAQALYK